MRVMVVGATGRLGRPVVERALARGHAVTAFARNPAAVEARHHRLRTAKGDVLDAASLAPAMAGQDAVISCLGTREWRRVTLRAQGVRNIISAMKSHGARRLIVYSAFGVADSREQLRRASFLFGRVVVPLLLKDSFDDMARMEEAVRQSGLEWIIVRPTALTDKPSPRHPTVSLQGADLSSVARGDVASFMVDQLASDEYLGKAPAISG